MNGENLKKLLRKLHACGDASAWVAGRDLEQAWKSCHRADWMLWLAGRMADEPGWPTRKQVVLAACDCAETALRFVRPGEDRPRIAIETARKWARGDASLDEVRADAAAAYAAAAYAADAAAYAAADADAADAAAYAAYYAADAADAAGDSLANDASSARAKALTELADVVRRAIPVPYVAPAEVGGAA